MVRSNRYLRLAAMALLLTCLAHLPRSSLAAQPPEPRPLWASSRVCESVARHRKYEHHLHNLRNIKPSIDNRDPRRPRSSNATGARLEEERNNQIMHENTILLNKLSRILTREPPRIRDPMLVRGLNDNHKRGERERIDRENQALLRRLQEVRPSIDAEAARQQYDLHLDMLARHQATWVPNPFLTNTVPNARRPQSSASATSGYAGSAIGGARAEVQLAPSAAADSDPMAAINGMLAGTSVRDSAGKGP
jgi:hypothetical protein